MYAECDDEAQAGDAMDVEARRVHALVAEFKQVQLAHIGQAREVATFSQDKFCTESEIAQTMARFNQATEDQRKDKFCIQPKLAAGVAALNNAEPVYTGQRVALQGKARGSFKTRRGPFAHSTEGNIMRVQQWRAKGEKFSIQSKVAARMAAFSHGELRSRVAEDGDYSLMGNEDVVPMWAQAITKRTKKRKREEKPKKKEKDKPKKKEKEKPKKKEKEKPEKKEKEKPKKEEKPKEKEKPKTKKKKKEKPKKKKGNAKKAKAKKEEDSNDEEEEERYFLFFKMMSYITRSQSMKVLCTKF